jgi:hypothetical protein
MIYIDDPEDTLSYQMAFDATGAAYRTDVAIPLPHKDDTGINSDSHLWLSIRQLIEWGADVREMGVDPSTSLAWTLRLIAEEYYPTSGEFDHSTPMFADEFDDSERCMDEDAHMDDRISKRRKIFEHYAFSSVEVRLFRLMDGYAVAEEASIHAARKARSAHLLKGGSDWERDFVVDFPASAVEKYRIGGLLISMRDALNLAAHACDFGTSWRPPTPNIAKEYRYLAETCFNDRDEEIAAWLLKRDDDQRYDDRLSAEFLNVRNEVPYSEDDLDVTLRELTART